MSDPVDDHLKELAAEQLQEETDRLEKEFLFGLRLATATQLMQGMLADGAISQNESSSHINRLIARAVSMANDLMEKCKE
jgi:hypothetical protein